MGIDTVAVFAEPDAGEPFVREAVTAVALPGRTSAETYLDIAILLDAAKRAGADAVHPGYGFLSENADFAAAVVQAGLTWVGPHPEAIRAMGDKLAAKRLLREAAVPMLESVELAADAEEHHLQALAHAIGYPVLVKAAGGGGGRGMRVVKDAAALKNSVASARREAKSAFGNDTVFLEKYLERARHVEIQIFGDKHGNVVHLFERECSIQRRHQKIVEEAPSPAITPDLRERMGAAAVAAGKALGYDNAGTVEFLVDDAGDFYFLEVNTRLQVEHPVTEEITGIDLVREQLRVAAGEPLSFRQEDLRISGHAIEVRLYAEDPAKNFLPSPGSVKAFERPSSPSLRWDSGVETGSEISVFFDPMLAKVIAHAPTRAEAALRLALGLERLRLPGLTTNRDFLVNTLRHEAFIAGDTTTDFIERIAPAASRVATDDELMVAGIAAALAGQYERREAARIQHAVQSGWRNNRGGHQPVTFSVAGGVVALGYTARGRDEFLVTIGDRDVAVRVRARSAGRIDFEADGARSSVALLHDGERWHTHDGRAELTLVEMPRFPEALGEAASGGYEAPMPGKVVSLHVKPGDKVKEGQLLLVLEAMKMEHHITCLKSGTITEVRVTPGQQVDGGAVLVVVE